MFLVALQSNLFKLKIKNQKKIVIISGQVQLQKNIRYLYSDLKHHTEGETTTGDSSVRKQSLTRIISQGLISE